RYVESELRYIFDNADLVALVHQRRYAPLVDAVRADCALLKHVIVVEDGTDVPFTGTPYDEAVGSGSPERDFEERSDDDLYILYTGGTTGMPKGGGYRHEG